MSKSAEAIHIFNSRANDYALKFNDITNYKEGLDFLCNNLEKEGALLDLACGPGNISNYILEKCPGIKLMGIDLAPKMTEIARVKNPTAKFRELDIREVSGLKQKFEAIVIGFGTPYLSKDEVEKLISDCSNLLLDNGLLYISTMEDNYEKSGYQSSSDGKGKMFIYYHESNYIQSFLSEAGLNSIYEKHQPYFENGEIRYQDYIVVGQKLSK